MASGLARELLRFVMRGSVLLAGALVTGATVGVHAEPASPRLVSVSGERTQEGTRVLLRTDAPLEHFEPFPLREPDRLVIDLPGATTDLAGKSYRVDTAEVAGVRVGIHPGRVRVVIDRPSGRAATPARVEAVAGGLLVSLAATGRAAPRPAASPQDARGAEQPPAPPTQVAQAQVAQAAPAQPAKPPGGAAAGARAGSAAPRLISVSGERTQEGTRLMLRTDGPVERFEPSSLRDPDRLVIDLPGATTDLAGKSYAIGTAEVTGVRVGVHPGRIRVVVDRPPGRAGTPARVEAVAGGLSVTLAAAKQAASSPATSPQSPPAAEAARAPTPTASPQEARGAKAPPAPPTPVAQAQVAQAAPPQPAKAPAGAAVAEAPRAAPQQLARADPSTSEAPVAAVSAPPVQAASALAAARVAEPARPLPEGLAYPVSEIVLVYAQHHPDLPPLEELRSSQLMLGRRDDGYVAAEPGVPIDTVSVGDVSRAPNGVLYGSAIRGIDDALVAELNRRGLVAIRVAPHVEDIDPKTDRDLRPPDQRALRLVITAGVLLEHRTFASGGRVPVDAAIDNPVHADIKVGAPIQPGDLVWKPKVDEYVEGLNRHSGRRVDTTLSAASEPGGVYLDYLVAEHRPLTLYAQAGNTGTEETSDWRERFGLTHTQLTGHDDVLRIDYITGDFDAVNASWASYETPLPGLDRVRGRLGGSWSEYDAAELGSGANFNGKQWDVGLEGIVNVLQYESLFVDLFAGARWLEIRVKNDPIPGFALVSTEGEDNFFLPAVGVRLERLRETSALTASLAYEWNVASFANTDAKELADLGRVDVDDSHFKTLAWDTNASLYLDPYLDRIGLGNDEYPGARLAHEVAFLTRGQYAFGDRLAPQFEQVAGGLYSVRGYPQSLVAGDDVAIGSAEYRLHIPRLLGYRPTPLKLPGIGDFRVAAQQPYGSPDWDLIVRAFVDGASTGVNDPLPGESDETLFGAGAGLELRLLRNWIIRLDWGRALRSAGTPPDRQDEGDNEYYFQTTLLW